MPGKKKRGKSSATRQRNKTRSKSRRRAASSRAGGKRAVAAYVLLLLLVATGVYLGYLNHLINTRFEGDTWALPSRVYARALELYPGLALSREQIEYELGLSSYLPVETEPLPGQYRRLGASIELHARAFDFSGELQAARLLQVFFENGQIAALTDSVSGADLPLFRLPPVIIGSYYPDNDEDRLLLAADEVPQRLVDALIAVEDRRFFDHHGLSPKAILRALLANIEAGKTVQGGSTLTQQLAKNMFLTPEKSLLRKINEAFMALLLELRFDKKTI
ncbi:MAG: penicillin-binding protein 1B, partial [Gammaproteobacteria bacterium]